MATVNVPREQLAKILTDAEVLIADVAALVDQGAVAEQRLAAMQEDPSTHRSEEELDAYLARRGVQLDRVDD